MNTLELPEPLKALLSRGVRCPDPRQVHIDVSVRPDHIAPGVLLHPGTRVTGAGTSIGPDSELGAEGPVVLEDCQLGHGVRLKGGFFSSSVFLDGAAMGSAAHVRGGTLLEEQAEGAHAVGFKQTILLPFVVTGSLVNFCDILMAGGTSRRDHSEVGSSYVHFNFTPYGDKATASLVGDVPRGVLLDQPRIFLGGQGGLVGPVRIAFGTVIPAGCVQRGDMDVPGLMPPPAPPVPSSTRPFREGPPYPSERWLRNNLLFIGNLHALRAWYRHVRRPLFMNDPYRTRSLEGALVLLEEAVKERIRRVDDRVDRIPAESKAPGESPRWMARWPRLRDEQLAGTNEEAGVEERESFLSAWSAPDAGASYLESIRALSSDARCRARHWLDAVVAATLSGA